MEKEIHIPSGFQFYGEHIGIKRKRKDFGVIVSDVPCSASAVFTQNSFCGVSIPIGKERVTNHELQAVVVTSGVANVATGTEGTNNALTITKMLAQELGIQEENILPSSTGVIGKQLPIEKIVSAIPEVKSKMSYHHFLNFSQAIMTTDKAIKIHSCKIGDVSICGVVKGSGMIEPNMATMLAYIITDAKIEKSDVYPLLKQAVDKSFNMMSIDTDTSTSDTVVLMANGLAGEVDINLFSEALEKICTELAKEVAIDAEGATKLIETTVSGAIDFQQAKMVAKSIINSPLVKTAIYGADPNWGRIVMAIGKTFDQRINPDLVTIAFGPYIVYQNGLIFEKELDLISTYLKTNETCQIDVDLGLGHIKATAWGCDLTEEYIKINALYTT